MDDLEGQIRQVLNDPAQMAQIMGLAQSLMGGGSDSAAPPPPADGGLLGKLGALTGKPAASGGGQQALLQAIRPYLSEKRQRKVDRALQITRMAHLAKMAMQGLGGSEHAETLAGQQRTL
jgi:hypothetical protein